MSIKQADPSKGIGTQASDSDRSDQVDDILAILQNSRRRAAIKTLLEHGNISKRDMVEQVTMRVYKMAPEEVPGSDERQSIHSSLLQAHYPKLERAGVIEVENNRVKTGPLMDEVAEYIELIDKQQSEPTLREKLATIF